MKIQEKKEDIVNYKLTDTNEDDCSEEGSSYGDYYSEDEDGEYTSQ